MFKDVNGVTQFNDPDEEARWNAHHAEFGPDTGNVHPDDCEFCKANGWDTHPEKTTAAAKETQHRDHMAEYGPATGKSHPDDCEKCE